MGEETFAPISPAAVEAVTDYLKANPRVGDAWLIPSKKDPEGPMHKLMAAYWLKQGEKAAGLPHVKRGGWHAFRRAWAQRRKDLSPLDVAAVGGSPRGVSVERCRADGRGGWPMSGHSLDTAIMLTHCSSFI